MDPGVTGMAAVQPGELGIYSRSSRDDDPRATQLPRASCAHWLVWAQAGVGTTSASPQISLLQEQQLSLPLLWARVEHLLPKRQHTQEGAGWLQSPCPCVLAPIPGGFYAWKTNPPPNPWVLNHSTNNAASATPFPEHAAAVSCLPVPAPTPPPCSHIAPSFMQPRHSVGISWWSQQPHTEPHSVAAWGSCCSPTSRMWISTAPQGSCQIQDKGL